MWVYFFFNDDVFIVSVPALEKASVAHLHMETS